MMEWIIWILALLFGGWFTTDAANVPATPESYSPPVIEGESAAMPIAIETVETRVMESFPAQISLTVRGYIDGCDFPIDIAQSRNGNTVTVSITRSVPPNVACPMIARLYETTIILDGGFEPGVYTIDVNGVIVTVEI